MEWALTMDRHPLTDRVDRGLAEQGFRELTQEETALVGGGIAPLIVFAAGLVVGSLFPEAGKAVVNWVKHLFS
jgi:hypothetical protein